MKFVEKKRYTLETQIEVKVDLTGELLEETVVNTGIGFLDHMLEIFAYHSGIKLQVEARGDLEVDYHHTVEDIGITLGEALDEALEDRKGLTRYGEATIPMEEALSQAVVDLARRPCLVYHVSFPTEKIGTFDTELIEEFFRALVMNSKITLHLRTFYGKNSHHIAESLFKAFAHAFRKAIRVGGPVEVYSTKGAL